MTIHISKRKLAFALFAIILAVPAVAVAQSAFEDVPEGQFYTEAVNWAAANGITTGTSATTFSPNDPVTRAQNVTFAKRYDDNIVQPALSQIASDQSTQNSAIAANTADIASNTSAIDDMPTIYRAWVTSGGAVVTAASSPGITATRDAVGVYSLTMPEPVNNCTWNVSHRWPTTLIVFDPDLTANPVFTTGNAVSFFPFTSVTPEVIQVLAADRDSGDSANAYFQIQVICG